jgi:hypothetical protein
MAQELIMVERRGWDALCSDDAVAYYRGHLTEDAVMAFPFGVMGREEALSAMATAEPWSHYDMKAPTVIPLTSDAGVVVYVATVSGSWRSTNRASSSSYPTTHIGQIRAGFIEQVFDDVRCWAHGRRHGVPAGDSAA